MSFKVEVRFPRSILLVLLVIFSANIDGAVPALNKIKFMCLKGHEGKL